MLTYDLEKSNGPMYEYLYRCIKNDIMNGKLKAGDKLPSKRNFAKNNGISTITIESAYDQLMSEGYIYSLPKRGYFVSELSQPMNRGNMSSGASNMPYGFIPSSSIALPKEKKIYDIDLSNNQSDPEHFPFSAWAKLLRETISTKKEALMIPSSTAGIPELRNAIAKHLQSFRGIFVDPNQIVIGAGTEYLYGLLIQLLGRDKTYCFENPGYTKLAKIYKKHEVCWKAAKMDAFGILPSELDHLDAQIAHISPNHHFPTGISMPAKRRYEILAWANAKKNRYIIEDDYDSEFRPNGKPIPPLIGIDNNEKVIYMNTFSKSLASTIRISYMVLPPHLANRFYEQLSFYACTVSSFEQYTLAEFIGRGYFEKHINRMRLFYSRQRKAVLDCIDASNIHQFGKVIENDSGLHLLLQLNLKQSNQQFLQQLASQKVRLRSMSEYYMNEDDQDDHRFLLNYSNLDIQQLKRALSLICIICQKDTETS